MAKFLITNDRPQEESSVQTSQWDDTQTSVQDDAHTPQSAQTSAASSVFADADFHPQENTQSPKSDTTTQDVSYDVPQVQDDTNRIEQTQEEPKTQAQSQSSEASIPNIYIQNDTPESEPVQEVFAQTQEEPKTQDIPEPRQEASEPVQDGEVDLDALFYDEPPKQEEQKKEQQPQVSNQQSELTATTAKPQQQWSMQRYLIAAWMLVAWGVILFFLFKMMFPLGVNPNGWSSLPTPDNTIVFDTGDDTQHSVATGAVQQSEPTQEEIREDYIFRLEAYAIQGEEYTDMGRAQRDNEILKYGLYIHKKSLDALDTLALSNDIDTTKLQALFDTFDSYIDILEWSTNGSVPPIQEPQTNTQPTTGQTNTGSTTTWSVQTGSQDDEFGF